MPPKGAKKPWNTRGSVFAHGSGFRVKASIAGRAQYGPTRVTEVEAKADLRQAQAASSETEYVKILQRLQADGGANDAAVEEPSEVLVEPTEPAELTEPRRKRQRTKGLPSTSVSQSAAPSPGASSTGLCQNKEDAP